MNVHMSIIIVIMVNFVTNNIYIYIYIYNIIKY